MATKGKLNERLTMPGQIHKAYKVMLKLLNPKYVKNDKTIPLSIVKAAKGIAFLTVVKAGFVFSGTLGSGIVIVKQPDGTWSGPSSIGVAGMGWGALIGASSTDSVIILNTDAAVKTFSGKGQIKFGGNLSVAVGPIGREAEAAGTVGDKGVAPCYSYSHSRGLFGGLSLQGAVLAARDGDNKRFYGTSCTPEQILTGEITAPENEDLRLLYECLAKIERGEFKSQSSKSLTGSLTENGSSYGQAGPVLEATAIPQASGESNYGGLGPVEAAPLQRMLTAPEVAPAATAPLLPGWKELTTPEGEKYYWNEAQNTTQWERPSAIQTPVAPPPAIPTRTKATPVATPSNFGSVGQDAPPAIPPRNYR